MKKKIAIRIMEIKSCFSVHLCLFVLLCFVATLMWSRFNLLVHAKMPKMPKMVPKSEYARIQDKKIVRMIQSHIIKDTMDKDPAIRYQGLIALGQWYLLFSRTPMTNPPRQPILDALLRDKDKQLRWTALLILGDLPEDRGGHYPTRGIVKIFQKIATTDLDRDFRRIAAVNLLKWGKLDKHEEQIWQYTLEMLQHPEPNYQDYALEALWHTAFYHREQMDYYKLYPSVRARIEEMARTPNPSRVFVKTVSYIWKGRRKGHNMPLVKWLKDDDYKLRRTSTRALADHSRKDGDVAAELLDTLRSDSSVKVRAAAATALTGHPTVRGTILGNYDLYRREFSPQMQKKVWNALVEAARNDGAPEVRAAALLSLANLKEGDASAWDLFTDAMGDKNLLVREAAVRGVGQAIYLQFNEAIEAALMHVASSCDDAHFRFYAIETLALFNYWDETIHNFIMDMLKRHPGVAIWRLCEYAKMEPRARQKLREEFRATDDERMKFYLAMVLVESGFSDREYIEHIVYTGLEDAKFTRHCIQLLGRSGYREPFVIEALLEKLRESLVAVEPYKATGANLYPVTNNKGRSYARVSRKGEGRIQVSMEALMQLDKYNTDLIVLLPQLVYDSGMSGMRMVFYQYASSHRPIKRNDERFLIRQARQRNR